MGWLTRRTIEVDFRVDVVLFRVEGREFDVTPSLHVASGERPRRERLRRVHAIGDRDGFPPEAIHIYFLQQTALPPDVEDAKQEYFAIWWRLIFELMVTGSSLIPRKPIVRVFVRALASDATRGETAQMIKRAALEGGAHSVDVTVERGTAHRARTG